jgi:hypothetical protein
VSVLGTTDVRKDAEVHGMQRWIEGRPRRGGASSRNVWRIDAM